MAPAFQLTTAAAPAAYTPTPHPSAPFLTMPEDRRRLLDQSWSMGAELYLRELVPRFQVWTDAALQILLHFMNQQNLEHQTQEQQQHSSVQQQQQQQQQQHQNQNHNHHQNKQGGLQGTMRIKVKFEQGIQAEQHVGKQGVIVEDKRRDRGKKLVLVPCCGPGHELSLLSRSLGGEYHICGSDLSQGMVALAQEMISRSQEDQQQQQAGGCKEEAGRLGMEREEGMSPLGSSPGIREPWGGGTRGEGNLTVTVGDACSLDEEHGGEAAALFSVFGLQQIGPLAPKALAAWARCLSPGGVGVVVLWPSQVELQGPWVAFDKAVKLQHQTQQLQQQQQQLQKKEQQQQHAQCQKQAQERRGEQEEKQPQPTQGLKGRGGRSPANSFWKTPETTSSAHASPTLPPFPTSSAHASPTALEDEKRRGEGGACQEGRGGSDKKGGVEGGKRSRFLGGSTFSQTPWEADLTAEVAQVPECSVVMDEMMAFDMEWESEEQCWQIMTYGGPWHARRLAQGDESMEVLQKLWSQELAMQNGIVESADSSLSVLTSTSGSMCDQTHHSGKHGAPTPAVAHRGGKLLHRPRARVVVICRRHDEEQLNETRADQSEPERKTLVQVPLTEGIGPACASSSVKEGKDWAGVGSKL